jgi:hypothetical protein
MTGRLLQTTSIAFTVILAIACFSTYSGDQPPESTKKAFFVSVDTSSLGDNRVFLLSVPNTKQLRAQENINVIYMMRYLLEAVLNKNLVPSLEYIKKHSVIIAAGKHTRGVDTVYLPMRIDNIHVLICQSGCGGRAQIGFACDLDPSECPTEKITDTYISAILAKYFNAKTLKRMMPLQYSEKNGMIEFIKGNPWELIGLMSQSEFCFVANEEHLWGFFPAAGVPPQSECFKRANAVATPPRRPITEMPKHKPIKVS